MLKKIYLSPLGYLISLIQHILALLHKPFMVYGFYNHTMHRFMKHTRLSSTVAIISKRKLDLADHVWIGHYSFLDASHHIKIGEGVQTGPYVSIFTHSSHTAIRLLGKHYLQTDNRIGYKTGKVTIGEYSFIGTSSIIFPGVSIGKGCLIKAGSIVTKSMPDYSIVEGNPAQVTGNVLEMDVKYFYDDIVQQHYFDKHIIESWKKEQKERQNANPLS